MKFQGFDGTDEELSSFLRASKRDISDIFKVTDTSKGKNIALGIAIVVYIISLVAFSYVPASLVPLVTTIMIICTIAVPVVFYLKYWRYGVLFPVLIACIVLTALILGIAEYNEIYEIGKDATNRYIDKQLNN